MFNRTVFAGTVLTVAATLISVNTNLAASKPVKAYKQTYLQGVRILKDCTGKTDYPHISKHVPGTVNVEATIKCPGREVTIVLSLTRITLKGNKTSFKSKIGNSKMTINASLPCTWKKGIPFRYVASAIYTEASGAHATHVVYRDLYC
jgi:hypothetical protein